ncbi:MFS transporter [Paenibacillus selenitireducens]|uniref:MFS transporter n=1 Tax=Paenibacillus selenitireducens TaxID=1324314 RepID=UPI00117D3534
MGAFITVINQTIMSVATPELIKAFDITAMTAQWLTTGYMLVNGVFIPMTAYLMQRFTTCKLFLSAIFAYLAGSTISGIVPSFSSVFGTLLT